MSTYAIGPDQSRRFDVGAGVVGDSCVVVIGQLNIKIAEALSVPLLF